MTKGVKDFDKILKFDGFKIGLVVFFMMCVFVLINARLMTLYWSGYFSKKGIVKDASIATVVDDSVNDIFKKSILTSDGRSVATSIESYDLYLDPNIVIDINRTAFLIKKHFPEVDYSLLKSKLGKKKWILIKRGLSSKERQSLIVDGIIGMQFEKGYKRYYTGVEKFSHILGYTDASGKGIAGIEKYFDKEIYNTQINLSVDYRIQNILYSNLIDAYNKFRAKSAFGVIMNVENGEILAMVSIPSFNPNKKINPLADEMINRNVSSVYSLGSVFKVFTIAFAFENGLSKETTFDVSDGIRVAPNRIIKDDHMYKDELSVSEIFYRSSNVGSGKIVKKFGEERYREFLDSIGVFNPLNITFPAGEIADPLYSVDKWGMARLVTASYGYGVSMSAVHFLSIVAGIVNNGLYNDPTLIKGGNKGKKPRRIVSESTSKQVIEIASKVVTDGTAKLADVDGYKVCGKTGTSQKFDHNTKQWSTEKKLLSFFSVFPCSNPKYVMYIGIDEALPSSESGITSFANLYGGTVAAPISGNVIAVISPMLGIAKDK